MSGKAIIDPSEYEKIKRMYVHGLVPMIKIAERYKVSRMAIYKVLKKAGVDVTKKGPIEIVCLHCGKTFERYKSQIRKLRGSGRYRYCSTSCFNLKKK